ncbi:MAG: SDR family oxidoreductase [Verrucomicrobia bacterium]|nr:SDR family oxidoreductase [Verrucomicrobiota bacterium]
MPSDQPLVWITGAAGLIGHELLLAAPQFVPDWRVRALTRAELDLTDFHSLRREFLADRPGLVIHCAALSRNPDCDANPALARRINVEATHVLADLAGDARLVFFSTDLVFDGAKGGYRETDPVNPFSVYGATKAEAETRVRLHPRHVVIRTSLNGGRSLSGERAFNEQLRRAWAEGREVTLYKDEFRSPLDASVTARAVWELALAHVPGVFHVAGAERLSRFEIGELVAARCPALRPRIRPGSLREHRGSPRPPDTSLNCDKAQALLSFQLPGLRQWLAENPDKFF